MATPQGDGSIILNTKVDTSGIKTGMSSIATGVKKMASTAGKAFLAIGAAATAATVSIVKQSVEAYAEYEQLVGGVETLFKNSSKKVLEYAEQAYKTTGQSANEYMQNVTAFSASLLSAVGGDTEKAAEVANDAMISISDNVNKMGSSAESVQLAFQGFAKQQYMLLDNLKLGYGGTKTEMERLLKDAQAITGVEYNIDNLADVYTAIGIIQEKLGIAGTTAKEAATTISGSAGMTKSAWQNVLTAISGGGDLDRAINNLVYSLEKYFENIVPVVEKALGGMGRLIEKVAPMLVQTIAKSLIKAIPSLLSAVYEMIVGLTKGVYRGVLELFSKSTKKVLQEQASDIKESVDNQKELTEAVKETEKATKKTLAGFDEIQILSSETVKDSESATTSPTSDLTDTGVLALVEDTQSELSGFEAFANRVFAKISEGLKTAWNYEPVQRFVQNSGALLTSFWTDLQIGVDKWGKPLLQKMGDLFASIWEGAMSPHLNLVAERWADFVGILGTLWDQHGKPVIDAIGAFANTTVDLFKKIYEKTIEPILKPLFSAFSELWDEYAEPVAKKAGNFFQKLISGINEIYQDVLAPFIDWYIGFAAPKIEWAGKVIADIFKDVGGIIADVFGRLFDYLGGVVDFVVGVFKGDWDRAWSGITQSFEAIWGAVGDVFKGTINLLIDVINGLISGINKVSIKMPDWDWLPNNVQGKSLGFDIPKIPKLAQGAVLPANRPFLAVVGDQKQGTNVEAPAELIKQMAKEAIRESGFGETVKEEHYYLNETQLMSILYKLVQGGGRINGGSLIGGMA